MNGYRTGMTNPCPDCRPDTELVQIAPNVWTLNVLHDDTCPAYTAMNRTDNR
jgi:hypothetical protein